MIYQKDRDLKRAVKELETSVKLDDKNASAWNQLGLCHTGLGDIEQGCAAYRRAIALDAKMLDAWFDMAQACKEVRLPCGSLTRRRTLLLFCRTRMVSQSGRQGPASEVPIVCGAGGARGRGRGRFQGGLQAAQAQPQGRAHAPGLQPHEAGTRQNVDQW